MENHSSRQPIKYSSPTGGMKSDAIVIIINSNIEKKERVTVTHSKKIFP